MPVYDKVSTNTSISTLEFGLTFLSADLHKSFDNTRY